MQHVTLTLPMISDMELTASKTAGAMGEHIGMSQDKIDEVQLAVIEACINAFEHSSANDRSVHMYLAVLEDDASPTGLEIVISDHGVGFAFDDDLLSDRPGATAPQKRGHGLSIIHGLMDEVAIRSNSDGTTITMKKLR